MLQLKTFSQFQICPLCVFVVVCWLVFSILHLFILPCPEANSVSFVAHSLMFPELLYKNKFSKDIITDILDVFSCSLHYICFIQISLICLSEIGSFLSKASHECLLTFGDPLINNTKLLKIQFERSVCENSICHLVSFTVGWLVGLLAILIGTWDIGISNYFFLLTISPEMNSLLL